MIHNILVGCKDVGINTSSGNMSGGASLINNTNKKLFAKTILNNQNTTITSVQ